jgi:hypothetical protein
LPGESVTMTGVLVDESGIRERWLVVEQELDERGRRMWAAAEARSHGWGGIEAVVRATGISEATVRRGIAEVESGERAPALPAALESLIDPVTRGDPESPLRVDLKNRIATRASAAHLTRRQRQPRAAGALGGRPAHGRCSGGSGVR